MASLWEPSYSTLWVELYLVLLILLLYFVITPLLILSLYPIEDITTRHPGPHNTLSTILGITIYNSTMAAPNEEITSFVIGGEKGKAPTIQTLNMVPQKVI